MTMDTAQPGSWRPRTMWLSVFLVFVLQVGLIFWLGEKQSIHPRRPAPSPLLQVPTNYSAEFLALTDPTLFALPHQQGFSGLAWLLSPLVTNAAYHPNEKEKSWSEEPRWLRLSPAQLGLAFQRIALTNGTASLELSSAPEPRLFTPAVDTAAVVASSSFHIDGALGQWRLLRNFALPCWPARRTSATDTDLLTNSVVQLVVDGQGQPVSTTLLTSSGSSDADNFALDAARTARFAPPGGLDPNAPFRANPLPQLCWGRLVFEWCTLPATNAAAIAPRS